MPQIMMVVAISVNQGETLILQMKALIKKLKIRPNIVDMKKLRRNVIIGSHLGNWVIAGDLKKK